MSETLAAEVGLLITAMEDKYVIVNSPSGSIDMSDVRDRNQKIQGDQPPLTVRRNRAFLIALSENGKMFVSPAGEVDIGNLKPSISPSTSTDSIITVSGKNGEKLVVTKDGKIQKKASNASPELAPKSKHSIKRSSSVIISKTDTGEIQVENNPNNLPPSPTTKRCHPNEVIISPLENGQMIFSPAGQVRLPDGEDLSNNYSYTDNMIHNWYLTIDENDDMSVSPAQVDVTQWIELF